MAEVTKAGLFILKALDCVGIPYRMGAEVAPLDSPGRPKSLDCSELVQLCLYRAGIRTISDGNGHITSINVFDGAGNQYHCSRHIPLDAAIKTIGALLFVKSATSYPTKPGNVGHVVISLGNGYIVEARGKDYGVVIGLVRPSFNLASKIDELYQP